MIYINDKDAVVFSPTEDEKAQRSELVVKKFDLPSGPFVCRVCLREFRLREFLDKHFEERHAHHGHSGV